MIGHHSPGRRASRPARARERGAVMVELALVLPLIFSLCVGTFEFGMAWRAGLAESTAVRSGVAAAMVHKSQSDFAVLLSRREPDWIRRPVTAAPTP